MCSSTEPVRSAPSRATAPSLSSPTRHAPPSWLPNAISALRILLVPVFWIVALATMDQEADATRFAPLLILLAIGGSDVLDGYLARKYALTSRAGVILDAVADRFAQFVITAFYVFVDPRLPLWFLGILILRDLVIGVGSWIAVRKGLGDTLRHEAHGKLASLVVFSLFLGLLLPVPAIVTPWLLGGATLAVTVSTVGYIVLGIRLGRLQASTDSTC